MGVVQQNGVALARRRAVLAKLHLLPALSSSARPGMSAADCAGLWPALAHERASPR